MFPRSPSTAFAATALALCLAPAWGSSTPWEAPLPGLERPQAAPLPFQAWSLCSAPGPWTLPPRLAASLSLACAVPPLQESEASAAPVESPQSDESASWHSLRGELDAFGGKPEAWIDLGGYLRAGLGTANLTRWPDVDVTQRRASLDNARLAIDAGVGPLSVYVSLEGSTDGGRQYLLHTGQGGELEVFDAYSDLALGEHAALRVGRFRAPVTFSTLLDENELLFVDRTGIGQRWFERDDGVALYAHGDRLEGWLAVQNGADGSGDEPAITARGVVRLFGEGEAPRREGAYDADLGETVYLGLSLYDDLSIADSSAVVAEASYSFESFALAGEALMPERGYVNGAEFWNVTASAMLVPERWELAARYEDFRDRAGARIWRAGLVRYLRGADTKLQLGLSRLEHPDAHLDLTSLDLTLVASF